ncbi:MAG: nucleotidyl transferase AbiEii/AbiGii toxin family protein [Dongiaceae bacterium]
MLPAAQRRLWHELTDIPRYFTLYGGTAIALRLAHRQSVDFDFFGRERFDPDALYRGQRFLRDAEVLQKTGDTLTCLLQRQGPVRVSFFALPGFPEIANPDVAPETGLKIASLIDLAGTKAAVVQKRAEESPRSHEGHKEHEESAWSARAAIRQPSCSFVSFVASW